MNQGELLPTPDGREPSPRFVADVLAEGSALGLYDRSDIVAWALEIVEREPQPSIVFINLAMASRLDESAIAELLHDVPGEPGERSTLAALVGVLAKGAVAGHLDAREAARTLYMLCMDAPGAFGGLARFDDDFYLADDGMGSAEEAAAELRSALRPFEALAAGFPLPGRWAR
jgi:hypothetical protein